MKEQSVYIFLIDKVPVESIAGKEFEDENKLQEFKSNLAASRGIPVDEIELSIKSFALPDYGEHIFVRNDGAVMYRARPESNPKILTGIMPAMDIYHEELRDEFLELLAKKQFDSALIFS